MTRCRQFPTRADTADRPAGGTTAATTETDWHNEDESLSLHCPGSGCSEQDSQSSTESPLNKRHPIPWRTPSRAPGTTRREETALKQKPNTVFLSIQPANPPSATCHYDTLKGNLMFQGRGQWGPKTQRPPVVTHTKEREASLHLEGIKNSLTHAPPKKPQNKTKP